MEKAIIITGGTGMVGNSLTNYLIEKGYSVHILSRNTKKKEVNSRIKYFKWDTDQQTYDDNVFSNAVAIVNLAGAGIADKRWTKNRKQEIVESRVAAGNLVTKMLLNETHQIKTLIQASAIGWYAPNASLNQYQEDLAPNNDFLGTACNAWENSVNQINESSNIRKVILRFGIVLNKNGGYVKAQILPLKLKVAPLFGNGNQLVSWIHQQDINRMIAYCINQNEVSGIYNAVSTEVVSQKNMIKKLATVLNYKLWLSMPIPSFFLKIVLGEMSIELLKSSNISNKKILDAGFEFSYPDLVSINKL
jgi:uncharacterized protein